MAPRPFYLVGETQSRPRIRSTVAIGADVATPANNMSICATPLVDTEPTLLVNQNMFPGVPSSGNHSFTQEATMKTQLVNRRRFFGDGEMCWVGRHKGVWRVFGQLLERLTRPLLRRSERLCVGDLRLRRRERGHISAIQNTDCESLLTQGG